jgi:hypothetical protein
VRATVGSTKQRFRIASASSSSAARVAAEPCGSPSWRKLVGYDPLPMPRFSRPPLTWSSVIAIFASSAGCRNACASTRCPMRMRSVIAASAVAAVHASNDGTFGMPGG